MPTTTAVAAPATTTATIQQYKPQPWPKTGGRNEHLVQAVKGGRNALSTTWRGSYSGICAVMKLTAHMVALQERMAGPRYDCYGPWAMCPADIVAQFA